MTKSPEQREGKQEIILTDNEIRALEGALSQKILIIEDRFRKMIERWEERLSDRSFEEAIKRTAAGAEDIREGMVKGNDEITDLSLDDYNKEQVYDNLIWELLGKQQRMGDEILDNIAIRKLMDQNEQFRQWINAIIAGAKKCDVIKKEKNLPERNMQGDVLEKNILG